MKFVKPRLIGSFQNIFFRQLREHWLPLALVLRCFLTAPCTWIRNTDRRWLVSSHLRSFSFFPFLFPFCRLPSRDCRPAANWKYVNTYKNICINVHIYLSIKIMVRPTNFYGRLKNVPLVFAAYWNRSSGRGGRCGSGCFAGRPVHSRSQKVSQIRPGRAVNTGPDFATSSFAAIVASAGQVQAE